MVCFYHLDDDGKCAAAIVRKFGIKDKYPDTFIEMNYGFNVPYNQIAENEQVYIVDFSILPDEMKELMKITKNICWIDHHVTAIKKYENFDENIPGIRSSLHSGCMLTYLHLVHYYSEKDIEFGVDVSADVQNAPKTVRLCDDYDMWRFNYPETRRFHAGFSVTDHDPTNAIWSVLLESDHTSGSGRILDDIISRGDTIIKYRSEMMENLIESYGYECTIAVSPTEVYKCFVLNQGIISSDDFDSIDKSKYDILVGVVFNGKVWNYSLRSAETGPDVARIAAMYGGGGHTHAAGFRSEFLIH